MSLRDKLLDLIDEADLQSLVESRASESRYIEYKQSLPGGSDKERREFLADVASFANAAGGDIVYGMSETDGVPTELTGIVGNPDAHILNLEQRVRTGIEPRIPGVGVRAIRLAAGGVALVLRVPRSFTQPHMVTFQSESRFFSRGSAGKYALDVSQIRAAFVASEAVSTRLHQFQLQRLGAIVAHETPVILVDAPKVVVHLNPLASVDSPGAVGLTDLPRDTSPAVMSAIHQRYGQTRFNIDGFLAYTRYRDNEPAAEYCQVFRTGPLEIVRADLVDARMGPDPPTISMGKIEYWLVESLQTWLALMLHVGAEMPISLRLALLDVRGARPAKGFGPFRESVRSVDRDTLILPELLIEHLPSAPATFLRPVGDALWNCVGLSRSPNYALNDAWVPRF